MLGVRKHPIFALIGWGCNIEDILYFATLGKKHTFRKMGMPHQDKNKWKSLLPPGVNGVNQPASTMEHRSTLGLQILQKFNSKKKQKEVSLQYTRSLRSCKVVKSLAVRFKI